MIERLPNQRPSASNNRATGSETGKTPQGRRAGKMKAAFKAVGRAMPAPVRTLYKHTIGKGVKSLSRNLARRELQSNIDEIRRDLNSGNISKDTEEGLALVKALEKAEGELKSGSIKTAKDFHAQQETIQKAGNAVVTLSSLKVKINKQLKAFGSENTRINRALRMRHKQQAIIGKISVLPDTEVEIKQELQAQVARLNKTLTEEREKYEKLTRFMDLLKSTNLKPESLKQINQELDAMAGNEVKTQQASQKLPPPVPSRDSRGALPARRALPQTPTKTPRASAKAPNYPPPATPTRKSSTDSIGDLFGPVDF